MKDHLTLDSYLIPPPGANGKLNGAFTPNKEYAHV